MKLSVLRPKARHDLRRITAHYRKEGGSPLALRWIKALEAALRRAAEYPGIGSTRHAALTGLEDLRCLAVGRFPYLIFYLERSALLDVVRVLHERRDIPELLRDPS